MLVGDAVDKKIHFKKLHFRAVSEYKKITPRGFNSNESAQISRISNGEGGADPLERFRIST